MPNWTSEIREVSGVHIHYWRGESLRAGKPKPPLLLLHGLTGSGACWGPVARVLEGEFDVVMPDARGHGRSSAPVEGLRYEDHAGDVVALIAALGLDRPFLLGHSMGGMTAALVAAMVAATVAGVAARPAARTAARTVAAKTGPAIRGVVLADPTFLSQRRQREVWESGAAARHRRRLGRGEDELAAEARRRHPRRAAETIALQCAAQLQTQISAFEVLKPPAPDYRQVVVAIRVPILLILAGAGGVVSRKSAGELRRLNPRVQIERIADAGHGIPFDQPERLAAAAARFLRPLAGS